MPILLAMIFPHHEVFLQSKSLIKNLHNISKILKYQNCTLAMAFFFNNMHVNPTRAPNTNKMQVRTHAEIEVSPSTFGELLVILVKILIKTRNNVTKSVIRPGTISGGMRKLA